MRKILAILLALFIAVVPLASCGVYEDEGASTSSSSESSQSSYDADETSSTAPLESSSSTEEEDPNDAKEIEQIVVVADMSASCSFFKEKMNSYIKNLRAESNKKTKIAVVAFANEAILVHSFEDEAVDEYLNISSENTKPENTDIQGALEYAKSLFDLPSSVSKRVILMSDGRQTVGNAWAGAKTLSLNDIRLDAVYFDVTADSETAEVQISSIAVSEIEDTNANILVNLTVYSTANTSATITITDASISNPNDVNEHLESVNLSKGRNQISSKISVADGIGLRKICAEIESNGEDIVEGNNTVCTWIDTDEASSSLQISCTRDEGTTRLTVETLERIEDNEQLVAYVTDANGKTIEYTGFVHVADTKYSKELQTTDEAGTYLIEVRLVTTDEPPQLLDKVNLAIVGDYGDEYDLFGSDGKRAMQDLVSAGGGEILEN